MNALNVIGVALNLVLFVLVLGGTLATLDDGEKTNAIQTLAVVYVEACLALNIFLICTR